MGEPRERYVWIASLGALKRGKLRVQAAVEALTPFVVRELRNHGLLTDAPVGVAELEEQGTPWLKGGYILGLAAIQVTRVHHPLLKLRPHEREQVNLWEALADADLTDRAFLFDIGRLAQLPEPVHMQQLSGRKIRGMLNVLEEGQAAALLASLQGAFPGLPQGAVPEVAVRLPAPYAALLAAGAWRSFALPQARPEPGVSAGTSGLQFNWGTLSYPRHLIPAVPPNLAQFQDTDLELTADMALEIADALRDHAAQLGHAALADDAGLQRHVTLIASS